MPTNPGPPMSNRRRGLLVSFVRFWQRSYAPDYAGVSLLLVAYILLQLFVVPFHRMFSLDNINIQYPYADPEQVPVPWLFAYCIGAPVVVISVWMGISRPRLHKVHVTFLGLVTSLILTSFLTDIIKNSVGRPRPDLLSRCKPKKDSPAHSLVSFEVCTETQHHLLHDGWRSFPSGHSSFAFSGLGYLALFMSGQMHIFRPGSDFARFLLVLTPLIAAAMIAISRCEDYRHDVHDVTVGSLLGFSVAYFTYRRYYPRLHHPNCSTPHPSRGDAMRLGGFDHVNAVDTDSATRGEFAIGDPDDDYEAVGLRDLTHDEEQDAEGGT